MYHIKRLKEYLNCWDFYLQISKIKNTTLVPEMYRQTCNSYNVSYILRTRWQPLGFTTAGLLLGSSAAPYWPPAGTSCNTKELGSDKSSGAPSIHHMHGETARDEL